MRCGATDPDRSDGGLRAHRPRPEGPRLGDPSRRQAADPSRRCEGRRRGTRSLRLTARVPATVANLGPGFDCFGLALALHNEVAIDTEAEPGVTIEGEGADELPRDESNLVLRTLRAAEKEAKDELPPFRLECTNRIPLERGLGSSAAAVMGGLLLANHVFDSWIRADRLLQMAVELEGHADNV